MNIWSFEIDFLWLPEPTSWKTCRRRIRKNVKFDQAQQVIVSVYEIETMGSSESEISFRRFSATKKLPGRISLKPLPIVKFSAQFQLREHFSKPLLFLLWRQLLIPTTFPAAPRFPTKHSTGNDSGKSSQFHGSESCHYMLPLLIYSLWLMNNYLCTWMAELWTQRRKFDLTENKALMQALELCAWHSSLKNFSVVNWLSQYTVPCCFN